MATPELARALVGLADEVRVSVDALAARNDTLRGAGNFEQAMRAGMFLLGRLRAEGAGHDHGDESAGFGRTALSAHRAEDHAHQP